PSMTSRPSASVRIVPDADPTGMAGTAAGIGPYGCHTWAASKATVAAASASASGTAAAGCAAGSAAGRAAASAAGCAAASAAGCAAASAVVMGVFMWGDCSAKRPDLNTDQG